jgi:hypothetical protein
VSAQPANDGASDHGRPGIPHPRDAAVASDIAGPSVDPDLLRGTLDFAGSYVSDDGAVTILRVTGRSADYSADSFTGVCVVCARAAPGEQVLHDLPDLRTALHFLAAHDHGATD